MARRLPLAGAVALALLLAACAPPEKPPPIVERPADFPESVYLDAAKDPANRVYRVDASASLLQMKVFKAGPLARLGHDHVVAGRDLHGYLLVNPGKGACRGDLFVAVDRLTVDEPALRSAAGMNTELSTGDIEATRANMLNHVLEVERFPFLQARLRGCDPAAGRFEVTLTAHGVSRVLELRPADMRVDDTRVSVTAELTIRQTDFGMAPFTALGGLLQVADEVSVSCALAAHRLPP